MQETLQFWHEMVAIGGLVLCLHEWHEHNRARAVAWFTFGMAYAILAQFAGPAHALDMNASFAAGFGMLQVPRIWGVRWLRWLPGVADRQLQAMGRFFLGFALACGFASISELYFTKVAVKEWGMVLYSRICIGAILFLLAGGVAFLLLDRSVTANEAPQQG